MPIFCKKRPFSKKHAALKSRFCQKKRPFSQKHCAPKSFFQIFHDKPPAVKKAHIMSKKRLFSQTNCSHIIIIKFFIKNPLRKCPHLVKKRQFCQKYTLWTQKNNRMSFFTNFSRKNYCLMPIYILKRKTSIL